MALPSMTHGRGIIAGDGGGHTRDQGGRVLFWLAVAFTVTVAYQLLLSAILKDTPDIRLSSARWYAAICAALLPFALTALAGIWVFQQVDAWRHTRSCTDPECAGRREVRA